MELENASVKDLRAMAKAAGKTGYSKINKAELVKLLKPKAGRLYALVYPLVESEEKAVSVTAKTLAKDVMENGGIAGVFCNYPAWGPVTPGVEIATDVKRGVGDTIDTLTERVREYHPLASETDVAQTVSDILTLTR